MKINIELDPAEDGIVEMKDRRIRNDKKVALVIGTNGEYRLIDEREIVSILERMVGKSALTYMGRTPYMMIYNRKKIISIDGNNYLAGSVLIIKDSDDGAELMDSKDIEKAKAEFSSRLVPLRADKIEFSAYELD